MKKVILTSILILLLSTLIIAQEFEINKIGEIAYAQAMTGSESIQVVGDHLFYLTTNGLEIYEINGNGSITKISMLTIAGPGKLIIKGQYCFLISVGYDGLNIIPGYHLIIYKIDFSNIYNPIIVDQIEYEDMPNFSSMFKFGDYLIFKWLAAGGFHYDFYSLPDLEYVGQIISDYHHIIVNNNLLLRQDGLTFYIEQYNPPNEFEVIGVIDVSAYSDGNDAFDHFKVINDSIISAINSRNITFWDISDATNWQYISRYTLPEEVYMFGNMQYAIMDDNAIIFDAYLLRLLDISDITTPTLVDSTERVMTFWGQACRNYNNNLYVSSSNFGIQHYYIENNIIEHLGSYYDYKRFFIGNMYDDKIIASNISTGLSLDGYTLFDVEDPLNSVDLGEWHNGKAYRMIHKQGDWMILHNYEDYTLEIYDINNLENPILRNTLSMDDFGYLWPICCIDKSNPNLFYLWNYQTNILLKFDILESGEPVQLFEYELPSTTSGLTIISSLAYVSSGTSPYDLLILDGLDDNEPYIANEIYNFSDSQYLDSQDGYLVTSGGTYDIGQVFQLGNPLQPELYFTPQWGPRIEIRDDLIFSISGHIISVYENRPNCTEPIAIFNGLNYIYNINLTEHEGTNYLITNERYNIGLFEYTYIPSSAEDELPKPEITLSNYPNPFNPTTTISFSVTQNSDFVNLEVYNIKGQKVKTLINEEMQKGKHSIIWSGVDKNNKPVSSGIYFYKLNVNGKTEAVKKCLLLK
ncbi:MAG: FlgD immunoglobulin-like domain containing protein [Candidatus Tenebribacter mawsonii]|nr:FlgD immunoglobulin-like domain containing protein [Candidatus Tenebribacter mawsonii]